jgi:hypothetical protein
MIASPRNISTALMYSFAQRKQTRVIDEPFYAYYLEETGVPHPGFDEILASLPSDPEEVIYRLKEKAGKSHLFIKNMSHHIEHLDLGFLLDHKVLLLIRDPKLQIASFSKVIDKPELRDIGIAAQSGIYDFLVSRGRKVTLIDAGELLKDPKGILERTCSALDIAFEEDMLSWDAGPISEDGIWAKYWYLSVHQSTGFQPHREKEILLEGELLALYEQARPHYEKLFEHAFRADSSD